MFNRRDDVWCERVYSTWTDLDTIMRKEGIPLFALESQDPIREFDFLGITIQFEMCYTNILQILELSQIPLHSCDRAENDPIVIGGGLIFRSIFADLDRRFVLNYCLGAFIYSSIKCHRSVCSWLNICNLPCQHTCLCVIRCIFARAVVYIIKTFRNAVCNDNCRRFNFRVLIVNVFSDT